MSTPALNPLRILIADDDKKSLERISILLEQMGHTVVGHVREGVDLLTFRKKIDPETIDVNIVNPTIPPEDNDGMTASKEAYRRWRTPSIFYTTISAPAVLEAWAQEEHVRGLILKDSDFSTLPFALGATRWEKTRREEQGVIFAAISFLAQRNDTSMHDAYQKIYRYAKSSGITALKAALEITDTLNTLEKKMQ